MFGSSNTKDNKMISRNHKCLFCGFNFKMGFTLIELLATLVVLAIIALIVYPTIGKLLANNKTKAYEKQLDVIEVAASNWLIENEGKLKDNAYALPINDIVGSGFIEENELINPINNEPLTGCIFITWRKNIKQYEYNYVENCEEFIVPKLLSLNASSSENEHGWRNKDFYVSLSGEYLENYYYCIDNKKCEPNIMVTDVNKTIAFNEEGIKYVCAYGTNKSGETESICEKYKLDKTKPVIGSIVFSGKQGLNNWFVSDVTVNVTESTDALSGIDNNILSPSETSITKDTKGTKVILTTKDNAGNTTTKEYIIKMDKTAPKIEMVNPTNGNWTNKNIEITSNFSDNISGIVPSSLAWSDDNTNWHNYSNTSTTTFKDTWSGEGNRTGYNRVCDYAGNCSTTSTPIRIDKTAPTVPTVTYNGGSNSCSWKNNYNLTLNSSDSLSGVRVYQVDWTGDSASNSDVTSNFIPWNGYSSCNNRFRAVDNAGNASEWTGVHHIHMDTEKPVHTNWWWGTVDANIAQLYIQATDNAGISRVQCPTSTQSGGYGNWRWYDAVWDSSQNAYRCDIKPADFGHYAQTYKTHLYIYDHAGNGGYYNETSANIPSNDTTKPTITGLYAKGAITNGVGTNTISATLQDNVALSGYYVTSDSTYSCSNATPGNWNGISGTSYSMNEVVTEQGTYYIWVKDATGNTSCTSKYIYRTGISTASTSTCAINNATAVDSGGTITLYLTTTCSCTTQNTCKNGWDYGTDSARSWLAISVNGSNMVVYNIGTVNKSQSFQDIAYTNTSNNSVAAYANSTIFAINGGFLVVSNGYGRTGITSTVDFGISKIVADNVIIYDGGFVNY